MKSQKGLALCTLLLMFACGLMAQTPEWAWVNQIAEPGGGTASSIVTDSQGNSYVTGTYEGTITLGTFTLTSSGLDDNFFAKLDSSGNYLWATSAGGASRDYGPAITADNAGNAYVTGEFHNTATFGTTTLTAPSGLADIFIGKLDSGGNFVWAVPVSGQGADYGNAITLDSVGNVFVTGSFNLTAAFGATSLTTYGQADIFVTKLDNNGVFQWAVKAGGTGLDEGSSLAVDEEDHLYLTGRFQNTGTFGAISLTAAGWCDIFAARLDYYGNFLWVWPAGGVQDDMGRGIAVDADSNVYLTGYYIWAGTFGTTSLAGTGYEIFAAKLDTDGNFLWAVSAGGSSNDEGFGIAVDSSANVYLAGLYRATASFGSTSLTCTGQYDAYVAKMDTDGVFQWAVRAGGTYYTEAWDIALDSAANIYAAGCFTGIAYFGTLPYIYSGFNTNYDGFIAKLSLEVPVDDDLAPGVTELSSLSAAYPNPFRQGELTQINTHIADRESGILSIFNLRGECVARHQLSSGEHQIALDSQSLPAGIYLYQLRTQTSNICKKVVLLK